jgi:hypothetical protein
MVRSNSATATTMKSGGVDKHKNNRNRGKREEAVPGTKVSIPTQSSQGKCEADVQKMEMQVATEKPVLECAESDDYVDFSMSSSDASDGQTSDNGKLYTEYGGKISELLLKYDKHLMLKNYKLVQRQAEFATVYKKFKRFLLNQNEKLKRLLPVWRTTWEYMFQHWLAYAEAYPMKKNKLCIQLKPKLNNWVKEQRRHFTNQALKVDHFELLKAARFIFQPHVEQAG